MEYIVIIGILVITLVILSIILGINLKKIKEITKNEELSKIVNKFPENIDICKSILKKLNNENVEIEEDKENKTSLYLVLNNKIIIGNDKELYSRIQTVAHECLHSVQSRKMLVFNYIYSNLYIIYFIVISVLTVFKVISNTMLQVEILTIMGIVYYFIRSMLEMDAMIKARYLAKEYIEESKLCSDEEIDMIINGYDKLNNTGIKGYNLNLLFNAILKIIIYCVICIIVI